MVGGECRAVEPLPAGAARQAYAPLVPPGTRIEFLLANSAGMTCPS
jgi:hypothetical protein